MKKTIWFIILLAILTSCKVWDSSMIDVNKEPINPRLLTLERRMEDLSNTAIVTSEDEIKLFTKEVEENLIDPYGDKYGYIALKRNILDVKLGMGFLVVSGFFACIPNLLGLPLQIIQYKVEVEMRILDRNNKLIGKYSAVGTSKVIVALYYGYSVKNGTRKAYPDALNDAFAKIRPQIQADAIRINEKLIAAGML